MSETPSSRSLGRGLRQTPRRVRVTNPRAARTPRQPVRPASSEINDQTPVGEVYVNSLVSSQRRLAILVLGAMTIALAIAPIGLAIAPGYSIGAVFGIPLAWLILGVAVYPILVIAGWWHIRLATRAEADFTRVIAQPRTDGDSVQGKSP